MKSKISYRDIKFFFFGILAMLVIELAYDWKDFKAGLTSAFSPNTEITK